jgi:phosphatidylinositol glycan class M
MAKPNSPPEAPPASKFWRSSIIFPAAIIFRLVLLVYGRWQDANSPLKYTDIDYLVFTDAARFVAQDRSPYDRATYRYTPLLPARALQFASIWLLNPMVANISTRGSSEGLLAVIVLALLWAILARYTLAAGCLLGFAVHFKIYPFIYAASMFIWLGPRGDADARRSVWSTARHLLNRDRIILAISSFVTFMGLNMVMYNE